MLDYIICKILWKYWNWGRFFFKVSFWLSLWHPTNSYLGKACFVSPVRFPVAKIMFETVHLRNYCLRHRRAERVSYVLGVPHWIWSWWWHWPHSALLLLNFCVKVWGEKDSDFWNMCFREKVIIWPSVYLGGHVEK